jgi:hypothetical protein
VSSNDRFHRLDAGTTSIEARCPSDPELRTFLTEFVAGCPSAPGWGPYRIQAHLQASEGRVVDVEFIQWAMNEVGR